jgi:hypothetical protein
LVQKITLEKREKIGLHFLLRLFLLHLLPRLALPVVVAAAAACQAY